jgi:hypothetical protein
MYCRWAFCAALLTTLGLVPGVPAERAPDERENATHVIVGTVEEVYVRQQEGTRHYLVVVAIEKVEKGNGFKPGETFYVAGYVWDPDFYKGKTLTEKEKNHLAFRGSPYNGVPREGQRIRVFAKHDAVYATGRPGRYTGIFPDWFDVVKTK